MKNSKIDKIDTLIGNSAEIEGNIIFSGGLRIDGKVNGSVWEKDSSTLIVSENASINGEINVTSAFIDGSVVGSVFASEYLELKSKANIMGDVNYASMEIHLGAIISGSLIHNENKDEEKGEKLNIENSINITDDALCKIADVMKDENNPDLKLRLPVSGGGCSGLQYGFAFETNIEDDDYILKK